MATDTTEPSGSVDFGRCFTFVSEDSDWIAKILVGGLFTVLAAVLVGIPFIMGYWARTVKNVATGQPRPLPAWDDLGGIFSDGLRIMGVYLAYTFGIILALALAAGVIVIPLIALGTIDGAEGLATALGSLGLLGFYALMFVTSFAVAVFLPAAMLRAAVRDSFAEGFAWRPILGFIKANLGNYALTLVIYFVASFLSQFGMILGCVGIFPAAFWAYMVLAYGLGETVRLNPRSI